MRSAWLPPQWRGRERIHHPVNWARLPECDVGVAYVQTKVDHGHENRWYLYCRKFNESDVKAIPVLASTVITASPGTTQTITSDATWNNGDTSSSIQVIGAGARGAHGASTSTSGGGGGGGGYTRMLNVQIPTPGTTPMYVRVGGTTATDGTAGGDSWWTLTSPGTTYPSIGATAVAARGGTALASATSATGSTGGQSSGSYPGGGGELARSGGTGANAGGSNAAGGGGGGAAGQVAGNNGSGTAGGAGNGNTSGGGTAGTAGSPGGVGGAGTNIQTGPNAGSGGGGGGGNAGPSTGGQGGLYGGGGGGGGRSNGTGGQGAQGVIVLTWTPIYTGSLVVTEAPDTAAFPDGTVAWNAVLAASEDTPIDLLLHLDGTNASTTFPDSGGYNRTVTAHGAAQVDTSQPVFGGQALKLAADADYLSVDTGAFDFGTGDFTVDFRARLSSASEGRMFFDGGSSGFQILHDGSALKLISAAGTITGSGLSANTNYHFAVTRASGSTRLFKDGVQQGSTLTDTTNYGATAGYPRIGGGTAATLDSATSAWVSAVVTAGGSVSGDVNSGRQKVVNDFIVGLKTDGIWIKLDRLSLYAAENSQSALIDLVALDQSTAVNSPTFTANRGYAGNGSTSYINTTYNLSTDKVNYTSISGHIGIWNNTNRGADNTLAFGFYDGGSGLTDFFPLSFSGGPTFRPNLVAGTVGTSSSSLGFLFSQQISSTGAEIYQNGSLIGTGGSSAAIVSVNLPFFVGARNDNGSPAAGTADQICMVSFGGKLTSTEAANYYSRLRTYMTAVGVP